MVPGHGLGRGSVHRSHWTEIDCVFVKAASINEAASFLKLPFMMRSFGYVGVCCFFILCACSRAGETLFSKLDASDTGIDFENLNYETERSNILIYEYFYNGGGVALGDINNDGLPDVYLTSNIFENKLYLNKGNFQFEDITKKSGTACEVGWKTGVTMVDINSDGYLDIYVCRSASPDPERRRNLLFINNHNNTFTEQAKAHNLDDPSYSTQAAFFDYDRDGDLDAFLLNHSTLNISNSFLINPKNLTARYPHVGNKLLRNDNGKFIDVSDSVGIHGPASNYGLGLSLSDINNDGWIDIYSGCDYTGTDRMLLNDHGNFFLDATDTLSHISKFTMGTDIADVNGDGLMDVFTLDMLPEDNYRQKQLLGSDRYDAHLAMARHGLHHQYMRNMLQLNTGNGSFAEIGQLAGISNTDWSWGALFADFDNDGSQDLFITNGFKRDLTNNDFAKFKAFEEMTATERAGKKVSFLSVIDKFKENKLSNYMFRNKGSYHFSDVTRSWGLDEPSLSNGVAYGDLDNDGDLDLVINNINEQAGVYKNNLNELTKANYLTVQLTGANGNKNAIGAKVTLYTNGKKLVRENLPVRGFQSAVDTRLHFGLGNEDKIDSMTVMWPRGSQQMFTNVAPNRIVELTQDNGREIPVRTIEPLMRKKNASINFRHRENEFIDFREQPLLPRMYSREGPGVAAADVNGDGFEDIFFGGAKGQRSELWLSQVSGSYSKKDQAVFDQIEKSEITDAVFFDADGDKDQDLFVVTGGYEFAKDDMHLKDFLLINDGMGNFRGRALPESNVSGSFARPSDFDHDGDIDILVGGRVVPGRYPESPETVLLVNNGNGDFTLNNRIPHALRFAGMTTDALWADLNNDTFPDLLVVGEWMPIKVFLNQHGLLSDATAQYIQQPTEGFWNCIAVQDLDRDGDLDFVAGNQGLNTQMRASSEMPVTLIYDDFDKNGSIDPIINYHIQQISYPYPTRDELTEQLPSFKKRFNDYHTYSNATIKEVLTPDEYSAAKKLSAYELRSSILQNEKGHLVLKPLPVEAQFAPLKTLLFFDIDDDGNVELLTGGNISGTRSRTGKMTGNSGFVFDINGQGDFRFISPSISGVAVDGDVKKILNVNDQILYVVNNSSIAWYQTSVVPNHPLAKK